MNIQAEWEGSGAGASAIAAAVAGGRVSATGVIDAALKRIAADNFRINAFTDVIAARAHRTAAALDAKRGRGEPLGPLAGVPFAVKNLFDVKGLPTRAGSKINRERAPAERDAPLVRRLEAAGAILVGALNMGEYAYDFTGENVHDGNCRNPHALDHMSGGSSSGSGAAVAAGFVPLALGSDTNGSIRVPVRAVRHLRPQADLRAPDARRQLPVRDELRPSRALRALGARPGPRVRCHAGSRPGRSRGNDTARRANSSEPRERHRGLAHRRRQGAFRFQRRA